MECTQHIGNDLASILTCDSFYFLWSELVEEIDERFQVYSHILAIVGALYLAKKTIGILRTIIHGISTHIFSKIFPVCLPRYGKWAVVTGPTEGIGKAFAIELAKRGMSIILLGRNPRKLEEISNSIQNDYGQETRTVIIDFNNPGEAYETVSEVLSTLDIGVVVNNVGVINDCPSYLYEVHNDDLLNMLRVNIESVTQMTRLSVIYMRERKRGFIINVSSISSLAPAPLLQVYAATKAYVTSFSRAVNEEVKTDGITVQTLIPSYVKTRMVGYSQRLTDSVLIPSPEIYVQSALNTLTYSSYSTGYWLHGIQAFIISQIPVNWYMTIIRLLNINFRQEYLSHHES